MNIGIDNRIQATSTNVVRACVSAFWAKHGRQDDLRLTARPYRLVALGLVVVGPGLWHAYMRRGRRWEGWRRWYGLRVPWDGWEASYGPRLRLRLRWGGNDRRWEPPGRDWGRCCRGSEGCRQHVCACRDGEDGQESETGTGTHRRGSTCGSSILRLGRMLLSTARDGRRGQDAAMGACGWAARWWATLLQSPRGPFIP